MKKSDIELLDIFVRTLNNCSFYMKHKNFSLFIEEIGCLRGIYYCLEARNLDDYISGIDKELFNLYIDYKNNVHDSFKSFVDLVNFFDISCMN